MGPQQRCLGLALGLMGSGAIAIPVAAEADLFLAYPPAEHQTTADRIFLIGTADPEQPVQVNGQPIANRSPAGHFAPSIPLQLGENILTLSQGEETLTVAVTRLPATPTLAPGEGFIAASLWPPVDVTKPAGELVCFAAIARSDAAVSVGWGGTQLALTPLNNAVLLPPNAAVLTNQNEPIPVTTTPFQGCLQIPPVGSLGTPLYTVQWQDQTVTQAANGQVNRLAPSPFQMVEVTVDSGTARTGPSTDYSRLTPLPKGTRAAVVGIEGEWFQLDYGAWIRAADVQLQATSAPPRSTIRSVTSREVPGWTEILLPLQTPVPVSVEQTADTLTLTLHNTTPQTDTIYIGASPVVERLDWTPLLPDKAQYRFLMKTPQQWGYQLRYEGTTLVLALRHPPQISSGPLTGTTILIDPGHGSPNDLGARGPNGYPEKDVNLAVSLQLQQALEARGATVIMTRTGDDDLFPRDRVAIINEVEPTLALSIHYNALPDAGDALNTAGIGAFWYNTQAHSLAQFLHDELVSTLDRPSYGVFWNNLALTRPTVTPAVLLELGFMINPDEFEWIVDEAAQGALAETLADAVAAWVEQALTPAQPSQQ